MSKEGFHTIFKNKAVAAAIIVAALGYFVDVFDLLLFSTVRVRSLTELGLSGDELTSAGAKILNAQLIGLLLGGIIFGVYGDKRGRISVLFGSILLYSIANILNSFVQTVDGYVMLRFLAGLGLAGELGAGITLVSELLPSEQRGYGTTLVAAVGVMGAIFAGLAGEYWDWRQAYFVGGVLGLCLLLLRVRVSESKMFDSIRRRDLSQGNLLLLLNSRERVFRYVANILVGLPIWFFVGVVLAFCPEIGRDLNLSEPVTPGYATIFAYVGLTLGDLASGVLSQWWRSRKRVISFFIGAIGLSCLIAVNLSNFSSSVFYSVIFVCGFFGGYWAVLVSAAAEQFGTNLRATVTTTVPNFIRGGATLMILLFNYLKPSFGASNSAEAVGMISIILAFIGFRIMHETFGRELDFIEK